MSRHGVTIAESAMSAGELMMHSCRRRLQLEHAQQVRESFPRLVEIEQRAAEADSGSRVVRIPLDSASEQRPSRLGVPLFELELRQSEGRRRLGRETGDDIGEHGRRLVGATLHLEGHAEEVLPTKLRRTVEQDRVAVTRFRLAPQSVSLVELAEMAV
jgi:hypothetical protein